MEEIWRPIKDYEKLYLISNLGNVFSIKRKRNLKVIDSHHGYKRIQLYKNGKFITCALHRLVANAFVENPHQYNEINHTDENPSNNIANNLEWCDRLYNIHFGDRLQKNVSKSCKMQNQWNNN